MKDLQVLNYLTFLLYSSDHTFWAHLFIHTKFHAKIRLFSFKLR